jgi:hypothetical protein
MEPKWPSLVQAFQDLDQASFASQIDLKLDLKDLKVQKEKICYPAQLNN